MVSMTCLCSGPKDSLYILWLLLSSPHCRMRVKSIPKTHVGLPTTTAKSCFQSSDLCKMNSPDPKPVTLVFVMHLLPRTPPFFLENIVILREPLREPLHTVPSTPVLGIWEFMLPSSEPCPLWPLFLPGIRNPRCEDDGLLPLLDVGFSEDVSPNRAKMLFFLGLTSSSPNPTSSNRFSTMPCGC